eukprot:499560-Hanusia_phi.AAC.3
MIIIFDAIVDLEASRSKEKRILVENIHPVNILSHGLVMRNRAEVTKFSLWVNGQQELSACPKLVRPYLVLFAPHDIGLAIQKAP